VKNSFLVCIALSFYYITNASNTVLTQHSSAILGKPNRGRFGDQLVCYCRAKWLSHKFNIPLLYIPFPYSDQLMLHEHETIYTPQHDQLFSHILHLPNPFIGELTPNNNTLYTCDWNIETHVDWNDNSFLEKLRYTISPRYPLNKMDIPDGYITIAAHVRTGGGYHGDHNDKREKHPLRFAPEQFFIEQIARIAQMFPEQKLYVHIFTDHQQPKDLKQRFKEALNNPHITFAYRNKNNSHDANVLEDFFSMMDFNCLIRPASNFSKHVQYLGNNKIVIYPTGSHKNDQGKAVIDTMIITTRDEVGSPWREEKVMLT
jgi:hypothetical protein